MEIHSREQHRRVTNFGTSIASKCFSETRQIRTTDYVTIVSHGSSCWNWSTPVMLIHQSHPFFVCSSFPANHIHESCPNYPSIKICDQVEEWFKERKWSANWNNSYKIRYKNYSSSRNGRRSESVCCMKSAKNQCKWNLAQIDLVRALCSKPIHTKSSRHLNVIKCLCDS